MDPPSHSMFKKSYYLTRCSKWQSQWWILYTRNNNQVFLKLYSNILQKKLEVVIVKPFSTLKKELKPLIYNCEYTTLMTGSQVLRLTILYFLKLTKGFKFIGIMNWLTAIIWLVIMLCSNCFFLIFLLYKGLVHNFTYKWVFSITIFLSLISFYLGRPSIFRSVTTNFFPCLLSFIFVFCFN